MRNQQPEPTNHKSVSSAGPEYCWRTWAYAYNAAGTEKLGSNGSKSADTACGTSKNFTFCVPFTTTDRFCQVKVPYVHVFPTGMSNLVTG